MNKVGGTKYNGLSVNGANQIIQQSVIIDSRGLKYQVKIMI
jgi:hypothetical protein